MNCLRKVGPEPGRLVAVGAKRLNFCGYIETKTNSGWMLEHRFVMEKVIGRKLSRKEMVHHIDGNKTNNDPENLILVGDLREHLEKYHSGLLKNPPTHHFGKRKWGEEEYRIFNSKQPKQFAV